MLTQSKLLPDGALGILQGACRIDNYLLGALNNEARETNDYRFESLGCGAFQGCAELVLPGFAQARPGDLRRALDILGRPAERILFIDDREENVAGALADFAGMKGIRVCCRRGIPLCGGS
jgi:putative hydrolase of the HAD superfamily